MLRDVYRHELGWERPSIVQREGLDAWAAESAAAGGNIPKCMPVYLMITSPALVTPSPLVCKKHDRVERRAKSAHPFP
jgi:hypothetical protein